MNVPTRCGVVLCLHSFWEAVCKFLTTLSSRINAQISPPSRGLFTSCEKKKKSRVYNVIYILYTGWSTYLSHRSVAGTDMVWSIPVLGSQSIGITNPTLTSRMFIDAFTTLPNRRYGHPRFQLSHIWHTHTYIYRTQLYIYWAGWYSPQSTQSAGPVRFLIFCSISIFLLASLVAGMGPQCTVGAD